jgi:hypothetical protein
VWNATMAHHSGVDQASFATASRGPVGGGGRESASDRVSPACGIREGPNESVESNPESNGMS